jgi:hypothetical protein
MTLSAVARSDGLPPKHIVVSASASARQPLLLRTNGGIPFNCKQLLPDFVHTDEWELTRYFASLAVATLARRTR